MAPTNKVHIPQLTWLSGFTNFMSGPARGVSTLAEPEVVAEPVVTDSSLGRNITQHQWEEEKKVRAMTSPCCYLPRNERRVEKSPEKKERLAAQVTGWRHDRDVIIGSEQEVTGRGGKSQKHLSLNSWRHPSCWVRIGFLFIPAPPTGQPGCVGDGGDTNGK